MDKTPGLYNLVKYNLVIYLVNIQHNHPGWRAKHGVKKSSGSVVIMKNKDLSIKALSELDTNHSFKVGIHPLKLGLHSFIF
ncbi:MAG TPA: hypothetical protein VLA72_14495 [Anaerolineales bacterium]|nr:hypothetical protein [Anaerolineales bacterium]